MSFTERFTEGNQLSDIYHADSLGAGTQNGSWVNQESFHRAALVASVGDMAGTSTVDISIQQAQDATGTGAKAITGKAITALAQAGGDGDDPLCIELRSEELDIANGFEFIRFQIVVANAASEMCLILFQTCPRYAPVATTNWTEIVD